MLRYENDCCDCATPAYPCRGASCPYRNVAHYYCDICGAEIDTEYDGLYAFNGKHYCIECLKEEFKEDAE